MLTYDPVTVFKGYRAVSQLHHQGGLCCALSRSVSLHVQLDALGREVERVIQPSDVGQGLISPGRLLGSAKRRP